MFYKFDKKELIWKKDWKKINILLGVIIILSLSSFIGGRFIKFNKLDEFEKELLILNIQNEKDKFTEEKLINEIKRLNIKFPYIVMAQAILESGNFKSKIFIESNNLFGMREAKVRVNTAKGTQYNHAYYDSWKESVYDYAFYSCRYMSSIKTEEGYFMALDASYAEVGNNYSKSLKEIIERKKLREIFK